MTREEKIARARELRAEGLTYREIGERLSVHYTTAMKWLNPERAREYTRRSEAKPERKRAKRAWENEHRAACDRCGGALAAGTRRADGSRRDSATGLCATCQGDLRAERVLRMVALRRRERLTNIEIAAEVGVPVNTVACEMHRMRELGFDVPASPYRGAPLTECPTLTRDGAALGRALAERGHPVPVFTEAAAA